MKAIYSINAKILQRLALILGYVIALPIFIEIGKAVSLAERYSAEYDRSGAIILPLSSILLPIIVMMIAVRQTTLGKGIIPRVKGDNAAVAIIILTSLSATLGILTVPNLDIKWTLLRYLQTIYPMIGLIAPRFLLHAHKSDRDRVTASFLCGVMIILAISLILYCAQSIIEPGPSKFRFSIIADHIGPFYNFKMKRFYPAYMAVAGVIALSYFAFGFRNHIRRAIALLISIGLIVSIATIWSRTAILMASIGAAVVYAHLLLSAKRALRNRILQLTISFLILIAILIVAYIIFPEQLSSTSMGRSIHTLLSLVSENDIAPGDQIRMQRIGEAVRLGLFSPLGDLYRPRRDALGIISSELIVAENGYLDLAIRGGPFALLALIYLVVIAVFGSWDSAQRNIRNIHIHSMPSKYIWIYPAISAILLMISLGGNIFLNLATEPYFAPFFWTVIGFALCLSRPATYRRIESFPRRPHRNAI